MQAYLITFMLFLSVWLHKRIFLFTEDHKTKIVAVMNFQCNLDLVRKGGVPEDEGNMLFTKYFRFCALSMCLGSKIKEHHNQAEGGVRSGNCKWKYPIA